MTPEQTKTQIEQILTAAFGPGHGCRIDIGGMLRNDGDTILRFQQNGERWELRRIAGSLSVAKA